MIQAEKNTLFVCLRCGISTATTKMNSNMSVGKCAPETVEKITIASFLLDAFCKYNPECTTTYIYSIDISKVTGEGGGLEGDFQVDLVIDGTTYATYTGDGTADEVADSFDEQVNTNSETTGFASSVADNVLTIWTCSSVPPADAPELVETDLGIGSDIIEYETTALANTTVDNMYNCITEDQACDIISKIKYLVTDCGC